MTLYPSTGINILRVGTSDIGKALIEVLRCEVLLPGVLDRRRQEFNPSLGTTGRATVRAEAASNLWFTHTPWVYLYDFAWTTGLGVC